MAQASIGRPALRPGKFAAVRRSCSRRSSMPMALSRALVKTTMPAPSAFHFFRLGQSVDAAAYPDLSQFFDDLVAVYRAELAELARAGCRYAIRRGSDRHAVRPGRVPASQGAGWRSGGPARDLHFPAATYRRRSTDPHAARPPPLPRKLPRPTAGGYEPVAGKLFAEAPVDNFLLEYHSARAGDFRPLRFLPRHKTAVLGLVSSKTPATRRAGRPAAPHRSGRPRSSHRAARVVDAMRLCQRGRRQHPGGGRAVGQARIGGGDG